MNKLWILFKRNCAGSLRVGKKIQKKFKKQKIENIFNEKQSQFLRLAYIYIIYMKTCYIGEFVNIKIGRF